MAVTDSGPSSDWAEASRIVDNGLIASLDFGLGRIRWQVHWFGKRGRSFNIFLWKHIPSAALNHSIRLLGNVLYVSCCHGQINMAERSLVSSGAYRRCSGPDRSCRAFVRRISSGWTCRV